MALPTDTRLIDDLVSSTLDNCLSEVTDEIYNTNAYWQKMYQRNEGGQRTIITGGAEIKVPILYDSLPAYEFGPDDSFGTKETEDITDLQFQYKDCVSELNLSPKKIQQNIANGNRFMIWDYLNTKARNAWMSLQDLMGFQTYSTTRDPSTGNTIARVPTQLSWDGIYNGIADSTGSFTTYGQILRTATGFGTPGFCINAKVVNAQNKPLNLSLLAYAFGLCVYDQVKPDVAFTTQDTWNDLANRVQPQDRNAPGPLRDVGFDTINYRGMEIIPDSHVLPGDFWGVNTGYWRIYLLEGRDMIRRSRTYGGYDKGFPLPNQDKLVDQLLISGDNVCMGPRMNFRISNIAVTQV